MDERIPKHGERTPQCSEHQAQCGEHEMQYSKPQSQYGESTSQGSESMSHYGEPKPHGECKPLYGDRNAAYDDDTWGQQVSKEHAAELNAKERKTQVLNLVRLLQWLVFALFGGAFYGYYCALKSEIVLSPWPGPWGTAAWYGLATGAGALSLLLPLCVYAAIARRTSLSAVHTMFDLLKAEFLKYGLMILCLGALFKLTSLPPNLVLAGFALMMLGHLVSAMSAAFKS